MATMSSFNNPTLTIRIEGADSDEGLVQGLIFNSPEGFPDNPEKAYITLSAEIKKGTAIFNVEGISPGEYAVVVFHDRDSDGKMRYGLFGIPKDKYGFSNNARNKFSAPSFERASFKVKNEDKSIQIDLAD